MFCGHVSATCQHIIINVNHFVKLFVVYIPLLILQSVALLMVFIWWCDAFQYTTPVSSKLLHHKVKKLH